jgi:hypothetical protein
MMRLTASRNDQGSHANQRLARDGRSDRRLPHGIDPRVHDEAERNDMVE